MIIGVDGYVTHPGMGGFTNYIVRLTTSLAASGDPGDRVVLYVPSSLPITADELPDGAGVEVRRVPFDMAALPKRTERDVDWHQRALVAALDADPPDVFLGTCQFLPIGWRGPSVLTVHDVAFEARPEYYNPVTAELYRTWGRASADRADAVVTVSRATADEVRRLWGLAGTPVTATPLSVALPFVPRARDASRAAVEAHFGWSGRYLLTPSAGHRRKNLAGAVRAFAALPPEVRGDLRLVLSNARLPRTDETLAACGDAADAVVVTDWVPDTLMPHLYAAATALLYPTFYEGFGLPVLEAMACGTPVLSSSTTSIPEVAGDAAVLVDPYRQDEVDAGLLRMLTEPGLRRSLRTAGRLRSTRFSWERTARLTREVLARAAA